MICDKIFKSFHYSCHLKTLIVYNYELLDESATDENESIASDNEDLSIVFMTADEAEEDQH